MLAGNDILASQTQLYFKKEGNFLIVRQDCHQSAPKHKTQGLLIYLFSGRKQCKIIYKNIIQGRYLVK